MERPIFSLLAGLAAAIAAAALQLPARAEPGFVGDEVCYGCHEDLRAAYAKTVHARLFTPENGLDARMQLGCEGCHGPGAAHVEAGGGPGTGEGWLAFRAEDEEAGARENDACLACHGGGRRLYWKGSPHESRALACTSCHRVMEQESPRHQLAAASEMDACGSCHVLQKAQMFRSSHMPVREGRMSCSDCHDAHGTVTETLLTRVSANETCLSCHAEKRGPFLWEHPPVTESCLNCHLPHGSVRRNMLKLSGPRLCHQCHVATAHPSQPRSATDRFVVAGSCQQCHVNIHGSNHPSGFVFTR